MTLLELLLIHRYSTVGDTLIIIGTCLYLDGGKAKWDKVEGFCQQLGNQC